MYSTQKSDSTLLMSTFIIWILFIVVVIFLRKNYVKVRHEALNDKMVQLGIKIEKNLSLNEKELLIKSEEYRLRKNDWLEKEKLPSETQLFDVYDTSLFSEYPLELTYGERYLVHKLQDYFNQHCIFADLYFKTRDDRTSQIDVVAVGKRGVFVFESKDYNGWIFGSGNGHKWTQVLAYGNTKNSFYNPIRQNNSHINILKNILNNSKIPFFSVIVLGEDATIKKMEYIPDGVFVVTALRLRDLFFDLQEKPELLSASEIDEISKTIKSSRIIPDKETRIKHIDDIKDLIGDYRVYR